MTRLTHWQGEPVGVWEAVWSIPLLESHDAIGSTNDRARVLAAEGARPWSVVIAATQHAGRGRGSGGWFSPPGGGLWLSILGPGVAGGVPMHLPLIVGLAVARALEEVATLHVGIEWPNDLIVERRKIGGILCERAGASTVVGIGINLRTPPGGFPAEFAARAGAVEDTTASVPGSAALAGALVRHIRAAWDGLGETLGHADLQDFAQRDTLRGRPVVSQQVGRGVGSGVEPDGALLVKREDGSTVRVVAGSVGPE